MAHEDDLGQQGLPPPPQQLAQDSEQVPVPLQQQQQAWASVKVPALACSAVAPQQQQVQSSTTGAFLLGLEQLEQQHFPVPLQQQQQA